VEKDWKDLLALLPGGGPKIYAYVRVSSRHQTAEAQLHAIAQYAIREKVGLCREDIVSDIAVSANSQLYPWDKRPGLRELIKSGATGIIVVSRDILGFGEAEIDPWLRSNYLELATVAPTWRMVRV
jgi:hypothetical protein